VIARTLERSNWDPLGCFREGIDDGGDERVVVDLIS